MSLTQDMFKSMQSNFFRLTAISSLESARRKFFMTTTYIMSRNESRNQTFLGSGGRNESNSNQLARIREQKIFHELEVHHV